MLRSSRYCCLDSGLLYVFVKDSHRIINDFFTGLPLLLHLTDKVIIFIRMQVMEAQIFQLPFDIVNTKTVSQRSIYFYRFSCYTLLLVLAEYAERTHIVKSVSQFYNDNSDILSHRQEHFPEVFQLLIFLILVMELRKFRDTVYKKRNFISEEHFYIIECVIRVFHYIMKECRNDSLRINFEFTQNICDCERMDNIWFSGSPDLSAVCFVCKFICLSDGFKTFLVSYVRLDLINQLLVLCCFFSGKIFLFMLFFTYSS